MLSRAVSGADAQASVESQQPVCSPIQLFPMPCWWTLGTERGSVAACRWDPEGEEEGAPS